MFSDLYNPDWNQIFQYRLDRIRQKVAGANYATKEEYQAAVLSELNRLIKFQDRMQPLRQITRETPALVGGVQSNLDLLNDDVSAVASQLLATEQLAASLLNLYASTQSALRQRIRQMNYAPTAASLLQAFVGGDLLDTYNCDVDLNAGVVSLPVASQSALVPTDIRVGVSSQGALVETSALGNLVDGQPQTVFEWEGSRLELVFQFDSNLILNRIKIEPHDYDGLEIEEISCSPDGVYHENVLDELASDQLRIDASSNKFSGEYVIDFTPKETRYLKLVLRDCVGAKNIRLRGITFFSRKFAQNGYVNFKPMQLRAGRYRFTATQTITGPLTLVQHQVSDDGAKFRVIYPDTELDVAGPLWYRLFMQRNEDKFQNSNNPFVSGVQDPEAGPAFTASEVSKTTDLGGGIYQREIPLDSLSGPIRVLDRVVMGSLEVLAAGEVLASDQYSFAQNILSLRTVPVTDVLVRYQTSLAGQVNFNVRKPYFSPYVYGLKFGKTL